MGDLSPVPGIEALADRLSSSAAKVSASEEATPVDAPLVRPTPIPTTSAEAAAGKRAKKGQQYDGADEGDDDLGDQ